MCGGRVGCRDAERSQGCGQAASKIGCTIRDVDFHARDTPFCIYVSTKSDVEFVCTCIMRGIFKNDAVLGISILFDSELAFLLDSETRGVR